jgi:hypothetical protein
MKKTFFIIIFLLLCFSGVGQDMEFGRITITPYIPRESNLDVTSANLMRNKLNQAITASDAGGGFDARFVVVPLVNVLSETETATIPQKTSAKISITFFIGDGVSGILFDSYNIETVGVGDNHNGAIYAAIRKINVKDGGLQTVLLEGKKRILEYYNNAIPKLISEAEGFIAKLDYENALAKLSVIPSVIDDYSRVQQLITDCGGKIIERDNNAYLNKAKAAWSASPNEKGAKEAEEYLDKIIISSQFYKGEVEKLYRQMSQRLSELETQRMELAKVKIESEERLKTEKIKASAQVATAFFSALPKLVYNILRWF